jgi:carbamoyltransferase
MRDSLGRKYSIGEIDAAANPLMKHLKEIQVSSRAKAIVDLLIQGKTVGLLEGGAELGPRSLGHRSILCDARLAEGKAILNSRVKHREAFRPFAPVILEEILLKALSCCEY